MARKTAKKAAERRQAAKREAQQNRRDELRQRRAAAESKRQRRNIVLALVAGVIALAIIAVIATVVVQDRRARRERDQREAAAQIVPPHAVVTQAILANPDTAARARYTFDLFVDYQCSACKSAEEQYGGVWTKLAEEGFIKLQVHTLTFLDDAPGHNDTSSKRMARDTATRRSTWSPATPAWREPTSTAGRRAWTTERPRPSSGRWTRAPRAPA